MKKLYAFVMLMSVAILFGGNIQAQTTIIEQDFEAFTEGSEDAPAATDISSGYNSKLKKTIGWKGKSVFEAGGKLKVADGGNLETDYLTLDVSTNIKVTFDVRSLADYGGGCKVDMGYSASEMFLFEDNQWHTVSVVFEGATKTKTLKFSPYIAAEGLLIDNVKVEAGDMFLQAPEALQPTVASDVSFTATWKKVKTATSYLLDVYAKNGDEKDYLLQDKEVEATEYEVDGLTLGTTYFFTVRAKKEGAVSDFSNEIEVVEVLTELAAPEVLQPAVVTSEGFTAQWKAVEKASFYDVLVTRSEEVTESKTVSVLFDNFDKAIEGSFEAPDYPNTETLLDEYTAQPGWYGVLSCFAKGYAGLAPFGGDSSASITTPALDLSAANGEFSVRINMAVTLYGQIANNDSLDVNIYNGESLVQSVKVKFDEAKFKDYVLNFSNGTEQVYVELLYKGSNKVFIDEFEVMQNLQQGDVFTSLILREPVEGATEFAVAVPVTEHVSYAYCVVAYARTVIDGEIAMLASKPSESMAVDYSCVGISKVQASDLGVSVAGNVVNVELSESMPIRLFDITGRQVIAVQGTFGHNSISVGAGFYLLQVGRQCVKIMVR